MKTCQTFCLAVLLACQSGANAALFSASSENRSASLIELFSSEGCSSCPPAEKYLSALKGKPGLWTNWVPVCFHVDYWDYLGWTDRLARPEFTRRQYQYSHSWGSGTVYTPEFAVDGREWAGWGGTPPSASLKKRGELSLKETASGRFAADFAGSEAVSGNWAIHVAVLGFGIHSSVKAGENMGRELVHDFAVLEFKTIPLKDGKAEFEMAAPEKTAVPQAGLAAWVVESGVDAPVQVVGGWWER